MIKVAKFGGSSVANARQFQKVEAILKEDPTRKIVVLSACGKSEENPHKVTDLLYLCEANQRYGMDAEPIVKLIEEKHAEIIKELNIDFDLEKEMDEIRQIIKQKKSLDYLVSRGEYLSCKIMAAYLKAEFVDAKDVICMNYDGSFDLNKTKEKLQPYLEIQNTLIVPGFYGCLPNGNIRIMSRGGSDITGAILANVVDADVYENWTDVSGIYVADPRMISHPKRIDVITYQELREMSYMGANVLHEDAIFPVISKDIPIQIRNTNKKDNPGTLIVNKIENDTSAAPITGITGKKGFVAISASKRHTSSEVGFLKKALEIMEHYRISLTSVVTGVDSFSFVFSKEDHEGDIYSVLSDLKENLGCDDVSVLEDVALICIVGRGMKSRLGMSGSVFGELGKNKINIRTISQGPEEISIIVGVAEEDFEKAIEAIYHKFITAEEGK